MLRSFELQIQTVITPAVINKKDKGTFGVAKNTNRNDLKKYTRLAVAPFLLGKHRGNVVARPLLGSTNSSFATSSRRLFHFRLLFHIRFLLGAFLRLGVSKGLCQQVVTVFPLFLSRDDLFLEDSRRLDRFELRGSGFELRGSGFDLSRHCRLVPDGVLSVGTVDILAKCLKVGGKQAYNCTNLIQTKV
jgi:hypothetical protein